MKPILLGLSLALTAGAAQAGRSCEARKLTPQALERGLALAHRAHEALEAEHVRSGARVVVLARAGQDLTKYGLHYSHLGYAYRDPAAGRPAWRVLHKLNHCGTPVGALYRQGLGEFFLDDPWRHEAAWAVLRSDLQEALLPLLKDNAAAARLHQRSYSMVSYAWGTKYQQSNQWAVETLALAQPRPAAGRAQAQAWLRQQGYQPSTLRLGPLTRLGGRMSAANIAFDDHPNEKRFSDRIETVTVDSVFAWLARAGLASAPQVLRLDAAP